MMLNLATDIFLAKRSLTGKRICDNLPGMGFVALLPEVVQQLPKRSAFPDLNVQGLHVLCPGFTPKDMETQAFGCVTKPWTHGQFRNCPLRSHSHQRTFPMTHVVKAQPRARAQARKFRQILENLPFVGLRATWDPLMDEPYPIDYWCPKETASPIEDFTIGEMYAQATIRFMEKAHTSTLLGLIIQHMILRGQCGDVEKGFCAEIVKTIQKANAQRQNGRHS